MPSVVTMNKPPPPPPTQVNSAPALRRVICEIFVIGKKNSNGINSIFTPNSELAIVQRYDR